MKNMSFAATIPQIRDQSKDVTRRLGWQRARPGDRIKAVEKCMGLKKGETLRVLAEIEILKITRERLDSITSSDVAREGFPQITPRQFIDFFCKAQGCQPNTLLTRIEFKYVRPLR
jgi:hypothetical protein